MPPVFIYFLALAALFTLTFADEERKGLWVFLLVLLLAPIFVAAMQYAVTYI